MVKIFIVILNWNRPKDTIVCLRSIENLKIKNFKLRIVVVDNASKDGSVQMLTAYKLKNAEYKLLVNKENLGYAGGMNTGIKYALSKRADYIVPLNNDTLLDSGLITNLLRAANKNPKAGLLCPKIYFAKGFEFHKGRYTKSELGKVVWYAGGTIDWNNVYGINDGVDEVDKGQFDKEKETDFATGNCMFIRKKVLEDVGMFDEKYYMYLEDVELCVRIKKAGWQVLYVPSAVMWHKVGQSSGIGSDLNDYFIHRNRLLFGMKYATMRTKFALCRESLRFLVNGRVWQKRGIIDFYLRRFGKGSWQ
jgi:hypothetical protein